MSAEGPQSTSRETKEIFDKLDGLFSELFGAGHGSAGRPPLDRMLDVELAHAEAANGCQRGVEISRVRGGASQTTRLDVTVPAGVEAGHTLRLKDQGDERDGEVGHIFIRITIADEPGVYRAGADIRLDVEISARQARSGGPVSVQSPTGVWNVDVPPRSSHGSTVIVPGAGAVRLGHPAVPLPRRPSAYRDIDPRDHRGDLIIRFVVRSWWQRLVRGSGASTDS